MSIRTTDVTDAMALFGKTPYDWQVKAIQALINMKSNASTMLLVRPTGDGKSAVRDACSVITGGVSLAITPLLALSGQLVAPSDRIST